MSLARRLKLAGRVYVKSVYSFTVKNRSSFKKYWKNFLFYDDKPLLLGRRKQEVAMFEQSGSVKLGKRP